MKLRFLWEFYDFSTMPFDSQGKDWWHVSPTEVRRELVTVENSSLPNKHASKMMSKLKAYEDRRGCSYTSEGELTLLVGRNRITSGLNLDVRNAGSTIANVSHMAKILGEENSTLNFEIKFFINDIDFTSAEEVSVANLASSAETDGDRHEESVFLFAREISDDLLQKLSPNDQWWSCEINATLTMSDEVVNSIVTDSFEGAAMDAGKILLQDTSSMDATIVVEGAEVKCHRDVLIARSPVLQAMLQSKMKEGVTSTIEILDMTEQGVRAFLSYLYCREVTEISKSCEIALELLVAGNLYDIPSLRETVIDLLFCKDIDWYTPSVIMHLLQFARRKIGGGEDEVYKELEMMALAALKKKPLKEIEDCLEFKNMFADPKFGIDFSLYLLQSLEL